MPVRSRWLALTLVLASAALAVGIFANGQFRPTGLAAVATAASVAVGARLWPRSVAAAVLTSGFIVVALLLTVPVEGSCQMPIAEFLPHALEDAAGPHIHDDCQLESDRRSHAGVTIALGTSIGGILYTRRQRRPT